MLCVRVCASVVVGFGVSVCVDVGVDGLWAYPDNMASENDAVRLVED